MFPKVILTTIMINIILSIRPTNRENKLKELKLKQNNSNNCSQKSEAAAHESYVLSELIAKHSKPFTKGDFFKTCLIKTAEIV